MRLVVQRVREASVTVDGAVVGRIGQGLLVLVGCAAGDDAALATRLAGKVARLRIFADAAGKMNLDVTAVGGAVLAVSQFTLLADVSRGNRPGFEAAMRPEAARPLFDHFVQELQKALGQTVPTGRFGADMQVALVNDGPVTIIYDEAMQEAAK